MKKLISVFIFTGSLLCAVTTFAQTITWDGSASNDWNTAANWDLNRVPLATDDVVIPAGFATININTAGVCNSLTIDSGPETTTVGITGTNSLTVTGVVTIGAATSPGGFGGFFADLEKTLAVNTGTLTCSSITLTDPPAFKDSRLTASTGTINVSGDIIFPGGVEDVTFTDAGTLNIGGSMAGGNFVAATSTVDYNGNNQTISSEYTYNNLTFSGSGDASLDGNMTIGGDFTINTVGTLDFGGFDINVGGDWTNDNGTLDLTGTTINMDGAGQTIGGTNSTTFNDLTLSGSGTKTFGLSTTIAGNFNIIGVVADLGTFTDHTANGLALDNVGQSSGTWGSTASAAANQNDTYFANTGVITAAVAGATTFYSRQTGNWNVAATWSTVTYGDATNASGTFPQTGDIVNIGGDLTITVTAAAECGSIEFQTGTGNTNVLALNTGISLNVSGEIYIPTDGEDNTLAVGAGLLTAGSLEFAPNFFDVSELTISTGFVTISGDVTNTGATFIGIPAQANIVFTGTGTLQVNGDFLNSLNGTLTPSTGSVFYTGSSAQIVGDFTYNNLSLSGTGAKSFADAIDVDGNIVFGNGTPVNTGAFTHTFAGDWINNGATIDNSNSTIIFDGGTPTIGGTNATDFKNLTIDNAVTTFDFQTDVAATLAIQNGGEANLGTTTTHTAKTLSLDGVGQTPGTWGSTSSAAVNQNDTYFSAGTTGIVTITNTIYYTRQTGDWNNNTSWSTVAFGNVTNTASFPTTGDIARIGGGFTITVTADAECSFIEYETGAGNTNTVTINTGNTLDVTDAVSIESQDGDDNIMNVGAGTLNTPSLIFSPEAAGGAVSELTISTGLASITGDVSHTGGNFLGFKQTAFITFSGAGTLQVAGDFLTSADGDLTASTGTVEYNGTNPQTIADFTYYNLIFNNTASTSPQLTMAGDITINQTLQMSSGIVDLDGNTLTLGNGAASLLFRTASTTTNWVYNGTFERFWPVSTAIASNSGNFYGLFPVGNSSSSSYRPVEFNSTTAQTGAGSVSVTHVDFAGTTDLSPFYDDAGTDIEVKDNSNFLIDNTATGGTYDVSVTMTGFGSGTVDDYRLAKSTGSTTVTAPGTHVAATGTGTSPTANRTGVTSAELDGDWRITSTDASSTSLPVELISFKVVLKGKQAKLTWATAQEINNDHFEIEYSNDGITFEMVGTVQGNGTINEVKEYTFTHNDLKSGFNFYRLKQVDFDGQFEYSEIKRVSLGAFEDVTISVYPNPSESNATIQINEGVATSIELITLSGTVLQSIKYEEGIDLHAFDVTKLKAGMYLIRVQGPEFSTIKRLVVK